MSETDLQFKQLVRKREREEEKEVYVFQTVIREGRKERITK